MLAAFSVNHSFIPYKVRDHERWASTINSKRKRKRYYAALGERSRSEGTVAVLINIKSVQRWDKKSQRLKFSEERLKFIEQHLLFLKSRDDLTGER